MQIVRGRITVSTYQFSRHAHFKRIEEMKCLGLVCVCVCARVKFATQQMMNMYGLDTDNYTIMYDANENFSVDCLYYAAKQLNILNNIQLNGN